MHASQWHVLRDVSGSLADQDLLAAGFNDHEELRAILEREGNRSLRPESAERIERKLLGYSAALELLLGMADLKKQNTSA